MALETNMREVVQRLRAERSEAFAELQEFRSAALEVQRHLETLVRTTREFDRAMQSSVLPESHTGFAWFRALQEETARINQMAMRLLAAYGEVCLGVLGWGIGGASDANN